MVPGGLVGEGQSAMPATTFRWLVPEVVGNYRKFREVRENRFAGASTRIPMSGDPDGKLKISIAVSA